MTVKTTHTLTLAVALAGCGAPHEAVQVVEQPHRTSPAPKALCVESVEPGPMRGWAGPTRGDRYAPECEGHLVVPCLQGIVCDAPGRCACRCDTDDPVRGTGDCREMALGTDALSTGATQYHDGVCVQGRCEWEVAKPK